MAKSERNPPTRKPPEMIARAREIKAQPEAISDRELAKQLMAEFPGQHVSPNCVANWTKDMPSAAPAPAATSSLEPASPPPAPALQDALQEHLEPAQGQQPHEQELAADVVAESVVTEEHHEPAAELLDREDGPADVLVKAEVPQALSVERARELLAECKSFDEVKEIHDKAAAVKVYQRQIGAAMEAQQDAAEIVVRATRRMGEMLREMPKNEGAKGIGTSAVAGSNHTPAPTLADLGIEKTEAHRARRLAEVPEARIDSYIAKCREDDKPATKAGALRYGEEPKAKQPAPFDLDRLINAMVAKVPQEYLQALPAALRAKARVLEAEIATGKPRPEAPAWEDSAAA